MGEYNRLSLHGEVLRSRIRDVHQRTLAPCVSKSYGTTFLFRHPLLFVSWRNFSAAYGRTVLDECPSRASRLDRRLTVIQKSQEIFSFSSRHRPATPRTKNKKYFHRKSIFSSAHGIRTASRFRSCYQKGRLGTSGRQIFAVAAPIDWL